MEELIKQFQLKKDKVDNYLNLANEIAGEINSQCALDLKVILGHKCLIFQSECLCLNIDVSFTDISIGTTRSANNLKDGIVEALKRELSKNKNSI